MTEERAQHRLAAIMVADVVGYSRLIEEDEAGTLAALKDRRRGILTPLVTENQGRVVKVMGDGVLVEFGSAPICRVFGDQPSRADDRLARPRFERSDLGFLDNTERRKARGDGGRRCQRFGRADQCGVLFSYTPAT